MHWLLSSELDAMVRENNITLARGAAIEGYAELESVMCRLIGHLLGTTWEKSAIVFYNIMNTRSRNSILESLLEETYGTRYNAYWHGTPGSRGNPRVGGLLALIRQIDEKRNQIAHWPNMGYRDEDWHLTYRIVRPTAFYGGKFTNNITTEALAEFINKIRFVYRSTLCFLFMIQGTLDSTPDLLSTWQKICQQPVTYPPSDTHPLSPNYKAPESPPPPSGG